MSEGPSLSERIRKANVPGDAITRESTLVVADPSGAPSSVLPHRAGAHEFPISAETPSVRRYAALHPKFHFRRHP